ncbi:MAG: 4Fe-4S binding protein [Rikenellaceae bacterium]
MTDKLKYLLNILIVVVMFMTVAVNRDAQILGTPVEEFVYGAEEQEAAVELVGRGEGGEITLNSDAVVEKVFGYGGKTPLKIYLEDDRISKILLAPNSETPVFLDAVVATGLLDKWQGMTLDEAASAQVDVVSGATMSSSSIIKNVQITAAHTAGIVDSLPHGFSLSLKSILALAVIAFGLFVNLLRPKSKLVRVALLLANVVVLGFWCGSFISLSLITTWLANGVAWSTMLIPFVLLVVAVVMPFVGRKGSYCAHHCPMGAAQELMGMIRPKKLSLPQKFVHRAGKAREVILFLLLLLMWCGVGFSLLDYELFSAFIFKSASCGILIAAAAFLILSIFVGRPYCRFVCPTGALLTLIQKNK